MKKLMVAVMALALMAVTGSAFADEPAYSGDAEAMSAQMSTDSVSPGDSAAWPGSGVVETGAVPARPDSVIADGVISQESTLFNPFYPELRHEDLGGGGE